MSLTIYTVTTLHDTDESIPPRCVGFFDNLVSAKNILENNWGDLNEEGTFPIAVIEKFYEGMYPRGEKQGWYRYNIVDSKWVLTDEPAKYKRVSNFGMG